MAMRYMPKTHIWILWPDQCSGWFSLSTALQRLKIPTILRPQPFSNLCQWSPAFCRPISCNPMVVVRFVASFAGSTIL